MKEWPLLLVFTAALSSTVFATNDEEHKVDDLGKPSKEQEYTFSLSALCFNLSNIFSIVQLSM